MIKVLLVSMIWELSWTGWKTKTFFLSVIYKYFTLGTALIPFFLTCRHYYIYYLFIFIFVCTGLCRCTRAFSSWESGSALPCWGTGFSLLWPLLLQSTDSSYAGFSSWSTWAQKLWFLGSGAQVQCLWYTGLVAPQHVKSSWNMDQTHVPCIGR